jgi:tetratricopeptide (TPR) repeat protein
MLMNRFAVRWLLLIFPSLCAYPAGAQNQASHLEATASRKAEAAPAAILPGARLKLYGNLPLSTRSTEARRLIELSLDKYENHLQEDSILAAKHAIAKDPQFALGYATLSMASLGAIPDTAALAKARTLMPRCTPDEQLLVRWMTSLGDRDLLPAISAMNDLMNRYPKDPHILYLIADWLYYRQDYELARKMLENIHKLDPDFPPALNLLAYSYIQTGTPEPAKAIASLQRYAEVQPASPNPQDSLGEILRFTGDDQGSLEHYAEALKRDPKFISSQWGLGDTAALSGDYGRARTELDRAIYMASNPRDRFHAEFQKALVPFWEGHPAEGRKALDTLYSKAIQEKEPNALFEIGFGRALLAADFGAEFEHLRGLEAQLQDTLTGMTEVDRNNALAMILRERTRAAAIHGLPTVAQQSVRRLENLASLSRDPIVENCYEIARGYLLFAQGDFAGAADQLSADPRALLALEQLERTQEKLDNEGAAEETHKRIQYLRGPTPEWYLVSRAADAAQ